MTLDEIGAFVASACSRTVGTDLFKGLLPTAPDVCMAIHEYGGTEPDMVFHRATIAVEHPRVQVVVRGAPHDYATPRAMAELAYRAMAEASAQVVSGTRYLQMRPLQPPFSMGRDEKSRLLIGFNAQLDKEPS